MSHKESLLNRAGRRFASGLSHRSEKTLFSTQRHVWLTLLLSAFFCRSIPATAEDGSLKSRQNSSPKPTQLILEEVRIQGSERLSPEQIATELGLNTEEPIALEQIQAAQLNLLSLGLFKSAFLSFKKGSEPGHVILVVELEDDTNVLGPWAIGSLLAITHGEPSAR